MVGGQIGWVRRTGLVHFWSDHVFFPDLSVCHPHPQADTVEHKGLDQANFERIVYPGFL